MVCPYSQWNEPTLEIYMVMTSLSGEPNSSGIKSPNRHRGGNQCTSSTRDINISFCTETRLSLIWRGHEIWLIKICFLLLTELNSQWFLAQSPSQTHVVVLVWAGTEAKVNDTRIFGCPIVCSIQGFRIRRRIVTYDFWSFLIIQAVGSDGMKGNECYWLNWNGELFHRIGNWTGFGVRSQIKRLYSILTRSFAVFAGKASHTCERCISGPWIFEVL